MPPGTRQKVLVVEDEASIASFVSLYLKNAGYVVATAETGSEALTHIAKDGPALVVLDLMLPDMDGIYVCRRIRRTMEVPILMLTARDEDVDKIIGLEVGADDYMTKPFSVRELVARVHVLLRRLERVAAVPGPPIEAGVVQVDPGRRRVRRDGQEVHLTPIEFDLLHVLARTPGVVYTREQLLADVWGYSDGSGARTVDSHIAALRKKLGPGVVRTVHGVGYALAAD